MPSKLDSMHVSVVIVSFGREATLLETIEDLLGQTYSSYDITVVDQNPSPLTSVRTLAAGSGARLRMLHLRPPDTLVARNVGIRAAKGEIVLYVDDDIRCEKDFIAQHAAKYDKPEVGGAGGWIEAPTAKDTWKPETPFVESPFGCNMSFRREVLERVGGFDLRFHSVPSYGEERELSHRIREAGYSIVSAPAALVFHHVAPGGGQRKRESQDYWKAYAANFVLLFRRTKPWAQQLLFPLWLLRLRSVVRKHSHGSARESTFWAGVKEGLASAREGRGRQIDFLARTPEPSHVEP